MASPADLHDLAQELLDAGAEALDTIPDLIDTTYASAPTRQFVSPGLPVADCCELLATWVDTLGEGARSRSTLAANFRINRPTVNLMVLRCIPMGRVEGTEYLPPEPAALTDAAAQIHADGWALWNHLFNLVNAEPEPLLFARCQDLLWNGGAAQVPSGGCAGWRFAFQFGLDGYAEDLAT